jgi:chemotaxis protein MotB
MATFADMATLLMSFFVLLLAFSEMDVEKYKSVSGSMRRALGVESDSTVVTLPEGQPADAPEIRTERPRDIEKVNLQVTDADHAPSSSTPSAEEAFEALDEALSEDVDGGRLMLERRPDQVIIRIHEEGAFALGRARLSERFVHVVHRIRDSLIALEGAVVVAGHTDDLPIHNRRFRSNWDLSSARAASVVHELVVSGEMSSHRVVAQGYAETRPLVPNVDADARAKNRRVDIILVTKEAPAEVPVSDTPEDMPLSPSEAARADGRGGDVASGDAAELDEGAHEASPQ